MKYGWEQSVSAPQIAADGLTIVVPGSYHPLVVSPQWLLEQELIGQADYDGREIQFLIPNEVTIFKVGAFQVQCQPDKFQVTTEDESEFERVRDLVSGILRALPDVKVSQLGINRSVHFSVPDSGSWNAIGDSLVNNGMWDDVLPLSGMRAVIFWGVRADKYAGRVQVQVEPSVRYPHAVYVTYNDHYELTRIDAQPSTRDEVQAPPSDMPPEALTEKKAIAIEVLANNWRDSMQRFSSVVERIARQGKGS
jgi:hypothetical protein